MKAGIITLHSGHNCGAMLQAHAMLKGVESLGVSAEIIDYGTRPVNSWEQYECAGAKRYLRKSLHWYHRRDLDRQFERFASFYHSFLRVTENYSNYPELVSNPPDHDVLICGSDQIWNPTHHEYDPAFFLKFGRPDALRISYAPSFGVSVIPEHRQSQLVELTSQFHFLSCREQSGAKMLSMLTRRPVEAVVDPTLLLPSSYWRSILQIPSALPARYLLVYSLEDSQGLNDAVLKLSKILKLPVVNLRMTFHSPRFKCARVIRDAGPLEFLGLIDKAEFVITNSFHGVVFSILFQKQFFAPRHLTRNERISNLLRILGLESAQDVILDKFPWQKPRENDFRGLFNSQIGNSKKYLKDSVESYFQ